MLMNEATWSYVLQHRNDDVRTLALQGGRDPGVDLQMALQQIAGWQTARRKLPTWAAVDGIIYPPHLNMEQCSSEQTARYKESIIPAPSPSGEERDVFIDLTGGLGVDFYWMSQRFHSRFYVEQSEELCAIAEHNFRVLGLSCQVLCSNAADSLPQLPHASVIFLDPARRDSHGARTYGIADCTPNVLELLPLLLQKADTVILKLSPMLDWRKAVQDLGCVSEVHIVSVDNECKELLLVLSKQPAESLRLCCVNNDSCLEFVRSEQTLSPKPADSESEAYGLKVRQGQTLYLYEPNASIMKAGCFLELEERFAVHQLSANSHLFISHQLLSDFPGRGFLVDAVSSLNKREVKASLAGIDRANISTRNFPMTPQELRKRLKIKDGGDVYLFATTVGRDCHQLVICRKIG